MSRNKDLELTLDALVQILQGRVRDNPKGGIILDRGSTKERRIRFKTLLDDTLELKRYFSTLGAFTIGSCAYCTEFTQAYNATYDGGKKGKGGLCDPNGKKEYVHSWWMCKRFRRREGL